MILGIDIGNSNTKVSNMTMFESKVSNASTLNESDILKVNGKIIYLGEGEYDTTYRKVEKENYLDLLYGAIGLNTTDINNYIVLGLPIGQYTEDRNKLEQLVMCNANKRIEVNGIGKTICIKGVDILPEGVATVPGAYEGIVVDIGGRTTDCCIIENKLNKRKIINPNSIPKGTQNLYNDFIKVINSKYGLNLIQRDAERIIKHGLKIDGRQVDIKQAIDVFKEFIEGLINDLRVEYSLSTYDITFTGGGSSLLSKPINNRINNCVIQENSVYANALAYKRKGDLIWK